MDENGATPAWAAAVFPRLDSTGFPFSFQAQPGVVYLVEQTTNSAPPVSWRPLQVFPGTGLVHVTGASISNTPCFYRVRTQ